MHPNRLTFTRGQLANLAGTSDDVVTYWLRHDLLRPCSGGAGRGVHRRFDHLQVNLAGLLAELHRYGLNIAALSAFSAIVQHGIGVADAVRANGIEITNWGLSYAADASLSVHRHTHGSPYFFFDPKERVARGDDEILADHVRRYRGSFPEASDAEAVALAAKQIDPEDWMSVRLFRDLADTPSDDERDDAWGWMVSRTEAGEWEVFPGGESLAEAGKSSRSGIVLFVNRIFREIWGTSSTAKVTG